MKLSLALFISILSLAIFIPNVRAAEVELQPIVDTTLKKSAPDTSFSSAPSLDALYDGGTDYFAAPQDVHEAYIKFDLSFIPANKYIISAKLKVTSFGESTYGFSDIRLRQVLANWNDQTTWNSRPAYAEESEATLEVSQNQFPSEIDITRLVKNWYSQSSPNYGLVMRPFGDGNYQTGIYTADDAHISSKEGPNPPRLIISYSDTPPPTPSSSSSPGSTSSNPPGGAGISLSSSPDALSSLPGGENTLETRSETINYRPCDSALRSLQGVVGTIQAKVVIELRSPAKVALYYSPTSHVKPPGESRKIAENVTESSAVMESNGIDRNHTFVLNSLQSETEYFFSIRGEGITDCEHSFKTLSSVATIRNGQGNGSNRSETGQGNIFDRINDAITQVLTQGKPVSTSTKSGIATLAVTLLTLGQATVVVLIAGYRCLRQSPYSILARFLKRRNRITWGRIVSSHNSRGVAHAMISLFEAKTGRLIDRTLSDQLGLYGFIADPGKYRASVVRGGFKFPSALMPFGYQGGTFEVESQDGTVALDIPMDSAEYTDSRYHMFARFLYQVAILRMPLILLGLIFSMVSVITDFTILGLIILAIFGYLTWREIKRRQFTACQMKVVNAKGKDVPFVQLVVRGEGGIKRQLANSQGLTFIELPRGEYMAQLTTLPIANRPEVEEKRQSFRVTQRWGIQKIVLILT